MNFNKIPVKTALNVTKIIKHLEITNNSEYMDKVMKEYFGTYWPEFKKYWFSKTNEKIDWINFALAPHNAQIFIEWVFVSYPNVETRLMHDLEDFEK